MSAGMPANLIREVAGMIASQGYTADELAYCASRLPFDVKAAESQQYKTQNPYWLLPHIDRIIQDSRRVRRQLSGMLLSEWDIGRLITLCPDLKRSDFQRGGFTHDDQPLYRYAPGIGVSEEARMGQGLYGRGSQ